MPRPVIDLFQTQINVPSTVANVVQQTNRGFIEDFKMEVFFAWITIVQ